MERIKKNSIYKSSKYFFAFARLYFKMCSIRGGDWNQFSVYWKFKKLNKNFFSIYLKQLKNIYQKAFECSRRKIYLGNFSFHNKKELGKNKFRLKFRLEVQILTPHSLPLYQWNAKRLSVHQ